MVRWLKTRRIGDLLCYLACVVMIGGIVAACRAENAADQPDSVKVNRLVEQMKRAQLTFEAAPRDKGAIKRLHQASDSIKALGAKAVPHLVRKLNVESDDQARYCAILGLAAIGPPARNAIPTLIKAIDDPSLVQAAMRALGEIEPAWVDDCVPQLVRALTAEHHVVAVEAARFLGGAGPVAVDAIPELIKLLQDDQANENVVRSAAYALGRIDAEAPEVVGALLKAIERDQSPASDAALDSLLLHCSKHRNAAVPILVRLMKKHEGSNERFDLIEALGTIGPEARDGIPVLIENLADENHVVRSLSIQALGEIGAESEDVIPALIDALKNDNDRADEVCHAAEALGRIGPKARPAVPQLVEVLKLSDSSDPIREAGAKALGQIGEHGHGVVAALAVAVNDEYPRVRAAAAEALGKLGAPAKDAIPALKRGLRDSDPIVRVQSATALARIGPVTEEVVETLAAVCELQPKFDRSVEFAVKTLGTLGPCAKPAIPSLLKTLHSGPQLSPLCAAEALGQIGPLTDAVVPGLVEALSDDYVPIRISAAEALCRMGQGKDEAVATLIGMLKTEEVCGYTSAAEALGRIGPITDAVLPALSAALGDEKVLLRAAAAKALGQMGPPAKRELPALESALKDNSVRVRKAAGEALERIRKGK